MTLLKLPPIEGVTKLRAWEYPKMLWLASFEVDPEMRGRGIGGIVLEQLKGYGKPIRLQALADSDAEQPKLEQFYKRHGFVRAKQSALPNTFEWSPTLCK